MTSATDFRNSLPAWIAIFIIMWGIIQGAVNAVWLKLAFHPNLSWFDFMNELVSKPNEFFWVVFILYGSNIIGIVLGFLMLYGRSVSKSQEKGN